MLLQSRVWRTFFARFYCLSLSFQFMVLLNSIQLLQMIHFYGNVSTLVTSSCFVKRPTNETHFVHSNYARCQLNWLVWLLCFYTSTKYHFDWGTSYLPFVCWELKHKHILYKIANSVAQMNLQIPQYIFNQMRAFHILL